MTIRDATPEDAHAIATVQIKTWETTYRGLMPDSFLDAQTIEARTERWRGIFAKRNPEGCIFVATDESGQVVGFSCGGAEREDDPDHDGELYAIYVLADHHGHGHGRRLTQAVIAHLKSAGFKSMLIWVLAENTGARRFYESMGGNLVRTKKYEMDGALLDKLGYGWTFERPQGAGDG